MTELNIDQISSEHFQKKNKNNKLLLNKGDHCSLSFIHKILMKMTKKRLNYTNQTQKKPFFAYFK